MKKERKLMEMIMKSRDPARAAEEAIRLIQEFSDSPQAAEDKLPELLPEACETE